MREKYMQVTVELDVWIEGWGEKGWDWVINKNERSDRHFATAEEAIDDVIAYMHGEYTVIDKTSPIDTR